MLGKIEGRRRKGQQRMTWLDGITDSMDMTLSKLWKIVKTGKPGMLQSMGLKRVEMTVTEQQPRDVPCSHLYHRRVVPPVALPVLGTPSFWSWRLVAQRSV